jgi:hypothetical protein
MKVGLLSINGIHFLGSNISYRRFGCTYLRQLIWNRWSIFYPFKELQFTISCFQFDVSITMF